MALLLDSHVFYWMVSGHPNLSPETIKMIENNTTFVSVASLWELIIKKTNNKLDFDLSILNELKDRGYTALPIEANHAMQYYSLPKIHKDPFDRMIISQAQHEKFLLVTADREIMKYDVQYHEVVI